MNQNLQWQEPVGSMEADSVKDLSLDKRDCLPLCSVGESCWCWCSAYFIFFWPGLFKGMVNDPTHKHAVFMFVQKDLCCNQRV